MSNLAIIAEYNPFHKGHLYHLNTALDKTGAGFSIAVMSGNFIQRGIPAVMDKYCRAKAAVSCGIDLVLELPFVYATASARDFAVSAVTMLNKLGQIDFLAFGAENDDPKLLSDIADVLITEPDLFTAELKKGLSCGLSYAAARAKALHACFMDDQVAAVIEQPNNILAIEYLSALKQTHSGIRPVIIKRNQTPYHSTDLSSEICSATAIREHLRTENGSFGDIRHQLPEKAYQILCSESDICGPVFEDDFSDLLQYRMLSARIREESYPDTADMTEELYNRLLKLNYNRSFRSIADALKTKNITHTRINRALLHYITGLKASDMQLFKDNGYICYASILACKRSSTPLIRRLSETAEFPFITKAAAAKNTLSSTGMKMFQYDLLAAELYTNAVYKKYGRHLPDVYQRQPYIC